jgi:hypothetical protein
MDFDSANTQTIGVILGFIYFAFIMVSVGEGERHCPSKYRNDKGSPTNSYLFFLLLFSLFQPITMCAVLWYVSNKEKKNREKIEIENIIRKARKLAYGDFLEEVPAPKESTMYNNTRTVQDLIDEVRRDRKKMVYKK